MTVFDQVLPGELALPGVGHVATTRRELVAPGVLGGVETTARCELPLGFGRQFLAGPCSVSLGILERNVHDRVLPKALQRTPRAARVTPVRTRHVAPPVVVIAQIDATRWLLEHD